MYNYKQRFILKTALQLFMHYGFRTVTMDEIAQGSGISKKTIYQFFKDKNDVIDSLYSNVISIIKNRLEKIQSVDNTPVYKYIKMIEMAMEARQYISSNTIEDLKRFNPATYQKLQQFIDQYFVAAITNCIESGTEQGLYLPVFNSNLMAMICLSELDFLNETDHKKLSGLSSAAIKQQLTRHLIYGIATNAGKKQADKYFSNTQL